MRFLGLEISVRKAAPVAASPVTSGPNIWHTLISEPFQGAWQRNIRWHRDTVLAHQAVYACITLIASDIGKLRPKLVEKDGDGIWQETESGAFSPVLRKPNRYQNHIQFKEWWFLSKLSHGNSYALKQRDSRNIVTALYLLDPSRVTVLVAPDGSVFYRLSQDNLSGLQEAIDVPASEIIHDRMNCLFHPLVGTSPIFACGIAAHVGITIQNNSASFFSKGSSPAGLLVGPGTIDEEDAKELQRRWQEGFSGDNSGKIAVMGEGLTYTPLRMTAVDAQMIQHLKWTQETVCSTFHVPPFKIGVGQLPTYNNAEILNQVYYSDCLQSHIESFEAVMDEGLGLDGKKTGVELDLDGLLRMDQATQIKALSDGIGGAIYTPNEARKKIDLKPLAGGDTVYMQQQNHSLAALNKRDTSEDPFKTAPSTQPDPPDVEDEEDDTEERSGHVFWKTATAEKRAA